MKNNFKIIIIHGSYGNPEENWFPWLSEELEKKGFTTIRPKLPTPENQNLKVWLKEFKKQVGDLSPNTILVGHSLAPAFILNILQAGSDSIYGTILVSPFICKLGLPDFDKVNKSFIRGPFNWEKIKKYAGKIITFGGNDDPYVPIQAMNDVSSFLGTQLIIINKGGHLNTSAGYSTFPLLRDTILEITS
jgi:predicted alpha/beta hydrolase family esterase